MTNTAANREGWTDERIEALKQRHASGWSASLIAKSLGGGLSRNAVIGKIHRLGIQLDKPSRPTKFKPYPECRVGSQRRSRAPDGFTYGATQPKQRYQERPQPVSEPISSPNAKVWTERAAGECAYPISGGGADTVSCCNRCVGSYCCAHQLIVYQPGSIDAPGRARHRRADGDHQENQRRSFEEWAA